MYDNEHISNMTTGLFSGLFPGVFFHVSLCEGNRSATSKTKISIKWKLPLKTQRVKRVKRVSGFLNLFSITD